MNIDLINTYRKIIKIFRDLILFTIIATCGFVLATVFVFDVFRVFLEWFKKHGIVEINELITLVVVLAFAFSIFSYLKWKELRHEITKRRQVEEDLHNKTRDLEILNTLTQAVHQSLDLDEIYKIALDMVTGMEHMDMAVIYLVDEDRKEAVLQAQRNFPEDYIRRAGRIPYPKGITWKVINTGEIVNIEDAQKDPDIGPAGKDLGHHSILGVPITLDGVVIGVTWFLSYKERQFNEQEVELLSSIGNQIAVAIAKAKLYRELSKRNRYETIISTVTRSVHQSIELQEVLENAVDAMTKNIGGVEHVAIHLVEGEEAVIKAYRGHPDWFIERVRRIPYPKGFTWKTIIEGKPSYCPDVDQDTFIGPAGREVGTKSYLSMPVHLEGKTVGCINVHSFQKNAFDEEELKLLEIVARQIEVAINNARQAELVRESEVRYRTLVENTYDLIIETNAEGLFLYASPKHKDLLGYEPSELVGTPIFDNIHPDDLWTVVAEYQRAVKNLSSGHMIFRFRHKNGEWRWLESGGRPFQTVTGEARGIISSRDITERKRAEEALINNEARLRLALSAARMGTWDWDILTNSVTYSNQLEPVFGLPRGSYPLTYEGFLDAVYPEDRQRVAQAVTCAVEEGADYGLEFRVVWPDGTLHWVGSKGQCYRDETGRSMRMVGVAMDITERRVLYERSRKQAEELRALYEDLNRRNRDLEILNTITQAVHKSLDLEDVYKVALDMIISIENVDMAMVYLVDKDRKEAILQAHRNVPEDYLLRAERIPYSKGITWKVINTGEIMNVEDAQMDPDIGPAGRDLGHHSVLGIPIFLEEKVIGVIWFLSYKERQFNKQEIHLLSSVGNEIALAIAKAKLYRELSKKNRYETIISAVTRSVHQSINLQDVIENAVESMSKNIDDAAAAIYLVEGEDFGEPLGLSSGPRLNQAEAVLKAHRGLTDQFVNQAGRIPYPKGFTWKTIIEGKPWYCVDVEKDTVIGPAGREMGFKSYLSIPINCEGRTVGTLNTSSFHKDAFDEEELKLLEIVAQQIEVAMNNARQAEALQESKEHYRTLFDQSPVGVYMFDRDFKITHCNERFVQILRSSYDKIVRMDIQNLKDRGVLPLMEKVFSGRSAVYECYY